MTKSGNHPPIIVSILTKVMATQAENISCDIRINSNTPCKFKGTVSDPNDALPMSCC